MILVLTEEEAKQLWYVNSYEVSDVKKSDIHPSLDLRTCVFIKTYAICSTEAEAKAYCYAFLDGTVTDEEYEGVRIEKHSGKTEDVLASELAEDTEEGL